MYGGVFDGSGLLGGGPLRFNRAARADTSPNTSTYTVRHDRSTGTYTSAHTSTCPNTCTNAGTDACPDACPNA